MMDVFEKAVRFLRRGLRLMVGYVTDPTYHNICRQTRACYRTWAQEFAPQSCRLVHPFWLEVQPVFAEMILHGVPRDFLRHPQVQQVFFRSGFEAPQQYELDCLRQADRRLRDRIARYRESPVGQPTVDVPALGISANSLGMLYYYTRTAEHIDLDQVESIVEFGGGYGALCHVFLELSDHRLTYVIIDLPEMLALQYFFLRSSAKAYRVFAHTRPGEVIRQKCVNLVPLHLMDKIDQADLFISTFALSEAPTAMQELVIRQGFYSAKSVYLVGQNIKAECWRDMSLNSMALTWRAVQNRYSGVQLQPFHFADSWEMIAWDNPSHRARGGQR